MDNKVMVIRYDGKPPRQVEWDGKPVKWLTDTEGFPVLITCEEHAAKMCAGNPDRYRLYRSDSLDIRVIDPGTKAVKWGKCSSWYYKKESYEGATDENGDTAVEYRYNFYEDISGSQKVPATEEFITGKKTSIPEYAREKELQKENERLEGLNKSLEKQVGDLSASMKELKGMVEGLTSKKKSRNKKPSITMGEDK